MKTINLARQSYSDIEYRIHKFPDGQLQLEIMESLCNSRDKYEVVTRLRNGDDLFLLMQLDDIMSRNCLKYKLKIVYLLAARCDRLFKYIQPFTLGVVSSILNELKGCESIHILDAHSDEIQSLISNRIGCYMDRTRTISIFNNPRNCLIALPDKGAKEKYSDYIELKGEVNVILCDKVRDTHTGKLSGFKVIKCCSDRAKNSEIILIDDICDGGGTFIGLADKLRELKPSKLTLMVTHAIQVEGIMKVAKAYDKVIITNSFNDWDSVFEREKNIEVIDVLR